MTTNYPVRQDPASSDPLDYDLMVVGGGAAGFFTAITAKECNPDLRVVILEKGQKVLSKVRVSGGGRCNVTHNCMDPRELVKNYPRGSRELLGPFHHWGPSQMIAWLADQGVKVKAEADGRMFPVTDSSQTIIDCFTSAAERLGIRVWRSVGFKTAALSENSSGEEPVWTVTLDDGQAFKSRWLHVGSGGLRKGALKDWIEACGHSIQPLAPSLFTLNIPEKSLHDLAGVSVGKAEVSIIGTKWKQQGPMLVTHWGLSGPAILKLSAWAARWIHSQQDRFELAVNWMGDQHRESTIGLIQQIKDAQSRKQIGGAGLSEIPKRLWKYLLGQCEIPEAQPWAQLGGKKINQLAMALTQSRYQVTGKSMNKEEFVTCGGVDLKEVHFKTMCSKKLPNLSFSGEVLDIDGVTGGFNFQAAWTTSRIAGEAVAEKLE